MIEERRVRRVVEAALDEDAPFGDLTGRAFVPADASATAALVAREDGVFAGADVFATAMTFLDSGVRVRSLVEDGDRFVAGQMLARVEGPARAVLQAERVALNLVQRMSGIATLTARYVEAVAGHDVRVVDTRKTTPGLRALERQAVLCGGGHNHRFSLSDAVMAKDNHLAVLRQQGLDLTTAIRQAATRLPHTTHIEVEVDRLDQVEPVLASDVVGTIMLDNFSLEDLRAGVDLVAGRALVEASGGITLETIADVAATGVDVISVGALTHSVRSLDLGLDIDIASPAPDRSAGDRGDDQASEHGFDGLDTRGGAPSSLSPLLDHRGEPGLAQPQGDGAPAGVPGPERRSGSSDRIVPGLGQPQGDDAPAGVPGPGRRTDQ